MLLSFERVSATIAVSLGALIVGWSAEANAACSSGLACQVCDNGYTPTQMAAPIGPTPGDCSDADISAFVTACLGANATSTTCQTWQTSENGSSASCLGCLFTQDTASAWGFLVCTSTGCSINIPGCVDLGLGSVSQEKQAGGAGSCGDALNASYGCQDYDCGACTSTDFSTCVNSATTNECSSYAANVQSSTGPCAALDGDAATPASVCFPSGASYSDADFIAMATFMCGGTTSPGSDAGGPTNDGGGVKQNDAGKSPTDAGTGADGGKFGGGGCHCDAAGGGSGDGLAAFGVAAAVAMALARRKRRAG